MQTGLLKADFRTQFHWLKLTLGSLETWDYPFRSPSVDSSSFWFASIKTLIKMASFKISGLVIILIIWTIAWTAISAATTAAQKWLLDHLDLDKRQWQSWMYIAIIAAIFAAVVLYLLNINLLDLASSFIKK